MNNESEKVSRRCNMQKDPDKYFDSDESEEYPDESEEYINWDKLEQ